MFKILSTIFVLSFLFVGCGSGAGRDDIANVDAGLEMLNTNDTYGSVKEAEKYISKPGPFKDGEFGRFDLDQYQSPKDIIGEDGILIDVRNQYERENGQAMEADPAIVVYEFRTPERDNDHLNPDFVKEITELVKGDKNRKIILICHTGSRSQRAAKLLSENGFTNVYDIEGGFSAWEDKFPDHVNSYRSNKQ